MAKAIEQTASRLVVGHARLGLHGDAAGTVRQQVHDGDTVIVEAIGNLGVRFLGVDAPEISFTLPGENVFRPISDNRWKQFLSDPFAATWGAFNPPLDVGLQANLQARVGPGTAENHHRLAQAAEDALEEAVDQDMAVLGQTKDNFEFFLVFAHEVMDRYGRLLCFINRDQPNANQPEPRPLSYNERLLQGGWVAPYFIWPNIDPFRSQGALVDAVIPPGGANALATGNNKLSQARQWVWDARQQESGIFDPNDRLRLQPFEVRFLAQRRQPNRWVIDLGKSDDVLLLPENYYTVQNLEDRLYIPEEYVPLFVEKGWRREV